MMTAPLRRIVASIPTSPDIEADWDWILSCGHEFTAPFRQHCGADEAPCGQCQRVEAAGGYALWPARVCDYCADIPCTCSWATRESIREEGLAYLE